jgi:hypothetical protein
MSLLVTAAILNGGWAVGHNLKGIHPRTIPASFDLIWLCRFRGKDLNVIWFSVSEEMI